MLNSYIKQSSSKQKVILHRYLIKYAFKDYPYSIQQPYHEKHTIVAQIFFRSFDPMKNCQPSNSASNILPRYFYSPKFSFGWELCSIKSFSQLFFLKLVTYFCRKGFYCKSIIINELLGILVITHVLDSWTENHLKIVFWKFYILSYTCLYQIYI